MWRMYAVFGVLLLIQQSHFACGTSLSAGDFTHEAASAPVLRLREEVDRYGKVRTRGQRRPTSVVTARRQWVTPSKLSSKPAQEVDTNMELPSSGKFLIHSGVTATFASPDYPEQYPPNTWTSWIFDPKDEGATLHVNCPEFSVDRYTRLTLRSEDKGRQVFFHNSVNPPAVNSAGQVTASLRAGRSDRGRMLCTVRAESNPLASLEDLPPVGINDPICGRTKPITRIVGGNKAQKGAYPWLVGVTTRSRPDMFCGGSIISENFILTAAHCVQGRKLWAVNIQVRKYRRGRDNDELRYKVKRIILHPGYSRPKLHNDIALVELEEPLRRWLRHDDHRVRPVCLPSTRCRVGDGAACFAGRTASVAGWGVLQEHTKNYSAVLQQVDIPVLTSQACRDSQPEVITDDMLCTSHEDGGRDACQGDSGGPLTVKNQDGVANQIGIVSFGKGCGHKQFPAVYTRVSEYYDWIVENAKPKGD